MKRESKKAYCLPMKTARLMISRFSKCIYFPIENNTYLTKKQVSWLWFLLLITFPMATHQWL
ncbi:hypothetical protein BRYFOR_08137 [Marvinbryantia formatexigens DSM 14469]|uniref:Uncharacterized protein n=1 Tax=Marvinbryantia formatexigens DSM 14469 TaxID=478749 RepID=C6LHM6_9FIRM|nr:hypothetical protein BRYFOR_08137 [Marvinbryantia formatexigens DSM 14469]